MLILNLLNIGLIIVILVMTCSFTHKMYLIIKADRQEKYERERLHNIYKKLQEEKAKESELRGIINGNENTKQTD